MRRKQIAIDFDGTIYKKIKFPAIGDPVPLALETIKELKANGHEIILWTCRKDHALVDAIQRLASDGIEFHHVNEHPDQTHLSNKMDADIFIDDKALGCPLRSYQDGTRTKTYVDWSVVRHILSTEHDLV